MEIYESEKDVPTKISQIISKIGLLGEERPDLTTNTNQGLQYYVIDENAEKFKAFFMLISRTEIHKNYKRNMMLMNCYT